MPKAGFAFGHPAKAQFANKSSPLLVSDACVGIEIELEGVRRPLPENKFWVYHHEGSLRNNGAEYVFSQPLWGEDVVEALLMLQEHFSGNNTPVLGNDTSVHCHVDIRDLEIEELVRFIQLYVIFERVIYNEFAPERQKNIFSWPISKSPAMFSDLRYAIYRMVQGDYMAAGDIIGNFDRYFSANLAAILRFGSIEFRGHHGCVNSKEILAWVNALLQLHNAAKHLTCDPMKPYMLFKENAVHMAFRQIMHDVLPWKTSYGRDLRAGLRTAKIIANSQCLSSRQLDALGATMLESSDPVYASRIALPPTVTADTDPFDTTVVPRRRDEYTIYIDENVMWDSTNEVEVQ